jgi:putative NADH-flavin reductase
VFGVHGFAGSAITRELVARGHRVSGVTRSKSDRKVPRDVDDVRVGSVFDDVTVDQASGNADWIVVALSSRFEDGSTLAEAVPRLVNAAIRNGARIGFVGGSGGLLTATGDSLVMDEPWFPEATRPTSVAHIEVFEALRASTGTDWFQINPSGRFGAQFPGERTGVFRIGGDRLLVPENGPPAISGADFATAMVDEFERPAHHNERFTVGY